MKRLFSLVCVGTILLLLCLTVMAVNSHTTYAYSPLTARQANSMTVPLATISLGQQIDHSQGYKLTLYSYQLAARKAMREAGVINSANVHPNAGVSCRTFTFQNQSGSVCATIYLACVLSACVPYAVSVDFSQALLDRLATSTAAGATAIAGLLALMFPPLGPFVGAIAGVLAYAFVSLDNYARSSCGGHGAGIYINLAPAFFYFQCS